jgi:hypothetical protein
MPRRPKEGRDSQSLDLGSVTLVERRGTAVVFAARHPRSSRLLSRWGAVQAGTVDPEIVQEGEGGFVGIFDEELGGVEFER